MHKKSIGIMGYGRFGRVLEQILSPHFPVIIYDPAQHHSNRSGFLSCSNLFLAVPISEFENSILDLRDELTHQTIIDVCSVKVQPVEIMKKLLPDNIGIIATHPLFGPDSIDSNTQCKMMMHCVRDTHACYIDWKDFFSQRFQILEMTPDEHDRLAAQSQGIVHFIARVLKETHIKSTPIDTQGFTQLLTLVENNCKDTWQLFHDLQRFNPYTNDEIERLENAFQTIKNTLLL